MNLPPCVIHWCHTQGYIDPDLVFIVSGTRSLGPRDLTDKLSDKGESRNMRNRDDVTKELYIDQFVSSLYGVAATVLLQCLCLMSECI